MNNISEYIVEKLKISSKTKINRLDRSEIEVDINKSKKSQIDEEDIEKIIDFALEWPVKPDIIKTGMQGNLKFIWNKEFTAYMRNKPSKFSISLSRPERYQGCFKITADVGNYMPFEYPVGTNGHLNKDGSFKLPTIESVNEKILNMFKKFDLESKLK